MQVTIAWVALARRSLRPCAAVQQAALRRVMGQVHTKLSHAPTWSCRRLLFCMCSGRVRFLSCGNSCTCATGLCRHRGAIPSHVRRTLYVLCYCVLCSPVHPHMPSPLRLTESICDIVCSSLPVSLTPTPPHFWRCRMYLFDC